MTPLLRRLFTFSLALILVVLLLGQTPATQVQAAASSCNFSLGWVQPAFTGWVVFPVTFPMAAGDVLTFTVSTPGSTVRLDEASPGAFAVGGPSATPVTFVFVAPADDTYSFNIINLGSVAVTETWNCRAPTGSSPIFTDGRINSMASDAGQTAAIYCAGDGSVVIWSVDAHSVGKLAFTATKDEIAKVPANPDKNTLIKQAQGIALYRLHGGKLQVNAPNGYVYIWDHC